MRWRVHHRDDDAHVGAGGNVDDNKPGDDCADAHSQRSVNEHFAHDHIPGDRNGVGRSRTAGGERSRA